MLESRFTAPMLGVVYEPEYTSSGEIDTDIRMMKETGIGVVITGGRLLFDLALQGKGDIAPVCDLIGRLERSGVAAIIRLPLSEKPGGTATSDIIGGKNLFLPQVKNGTPMGELLPGAEEICKALSRYSNILGWRVDHLSGLGCSEEDLISYIRKYSPLPVSVGDDDGSGIFRLENGSFETVSMFSKEPCLENSLFVSHFTRAQRGEFFWQNARNDLGGFTPKGFTYAAALLPLFAGAAVSVVGSWKGEGASCIVSRYNRPSYMEPEIREAAKALASAKELLENTRVMSEVAVLRRGDRRDGDVNAFVKALYRGGYCLDIISELSFDRYSVIFTPYCPSLGDEKKVSQLAKWVENGGVWVAGPESDTLDERGEPSPRTPFVHLEKYTSAFLRYGILDPEGRIKAYAGDKLFA